MSNIFKVRDEDEAINMKILNNKTNLDKNNFTTLLL